MKEFNINTITIINQVTTTSLPSGVHKYLVKGKLIGGKRWKRGYILLTTEDLRHIKLKGLL